MVVKGGPLEEMLVYMFSTYSKFEFSHQITESQAFVLQGRLLSSSLQNTGLKTEKDRP